jgi:hypothetical protein
LNMFALIGANKDAYHVRTWSQAILISVDLYWSHSDFDPGHKNN